MAQSMQYQVSDSGWTHDICMDIYTHTVAQIVKSYVFIADYDSEYEYFILSYSECVVIEEYYSEYGWVRAYSI